MTEKNESLTKQILDFLKTLFISLIIVIILKIFILDATRVSGNSMLNTLHDGDMLFVNKVGKYLGKYEKGEIITLEAPDYPNRLYIKRIIGVPGDSISLVDGDVFINGEKIEEDYISVDETLVTNNKSEWLLEEDEYFVMGDNRLPGASNDSRNFGPIKTDSIVGHAFFRFYPFDSIGFEDKE